MSVLVVDIGNTRIKWARLSGEHLERQRALEHSGLARQDYQRRILRGPRGLSRIIVASVAGPRVERPFTAAARALGVVPEFVATARSAAGVTTRYTDPWRLGVDRFAAVIAAHHIARARGACVIDVGTAMTIDLVDGQGVHHGGAIVPGPQLMVGSLLRSTSGILRRARGDAGRGSLFAHNTRAAIEQGAAFAAAAAVDRAVAEAQQILKRVPLVMLTGGAAEQLQPLLRSSYVSVPDLVLRGVALRAGLHVK